MKIEQLIKITGFANIIAAALLLIWWFSFALLLPMDKLYVDFSIIILNTNWVWINIIGLIALILASISFIGIFLYNLEKMNFKNLLGFVIAQIGLLLFVCIQYYQTFIWPVIAQFNKELVQINGALVSGNTLISSGIVISGFMFGIGYIVFGLNSLKTLSANKIPIWLLMLGAPIFGNGIVFPIRTIGLVLFCAGILWYGIILIKIKDK